jgi:hypothetical protein
VTARLTWLEGTAVSPREVGARAAALARLRAAGLPVPRSFAVSGWDDSDSQTVPTPLRPTPPLSDEARACIVAGLDDLGPPFAIRRSPLLPPGDEQPARPVSGREIYLHLIEEAEVLEAVRRLRGRTGHGIASEPSAILVQRFIPAEASAEVRRHGGSVEVEAVLGPGDVVSAGLVIPDRHLVDLETHEVTVRRIGRKRLRSVPQQDGGLARMPIAPPQANAAALTDELLARSAELWLQAEEVFPHLAGLDLAYVGGRAFIVTVHS